MHWRKNEILHETGLNVSLIKEDNLSHRENSTASHSRDTKSRLKGNNKYCQN